MPTLSLTFLDETLTGNVLQSWEVIVETNVMPLKDLIMLRVEEEILRLQKQQAEQYFTRISNLSEAEKLLNPRKKFEKSETPDLEASGYRALEAFKKQTYFVLVNDRQVEDLEEKIALYPKTTVSFVRITPLVGG